MIKDVVVLGSTGLVGGLLLQELKADISIQSVTLLSRRQIKTDHPKVRVETIDFNNYSEFLSKMPTADAIFCCIGTTMRKMNGDKEMYRKVDHDIAVNAGKIGADKGFRQYAIVSSVGASKTAGNFYLKLKGEVEDSLARLSFEGIQIFQPSLLLGPRSESRFGEGFAKSVFPALSFLLKGNMMKYRAIEAAAVARAMLSTVKNEMKGINRYTYREIMQLGT